MNQTRAQKRLNKYGISLSREDHGVKRWLTTPVNHVEDRRQFSSIRTALEYWDGQARWLAFDTALATAILEHAETLERNDRLAFDEWMEGDDGLMPEAMTTASLHTSFPKNWKEVVRTWVVQRGSIAGIDIFHALKHARLERQAHSPPSEREAKHDHGVAER